MQSTSVVTHEKTHTWDYATPGGAAFGHSPSSLCCTLNAMSSRVSMHRLVLSIEHLSKQLECWECPKENERKNMEKLVSEMNHDEPCRTWSSLAQCSTSLGSFGSVKSQPGAAVRVISAVRLQKNTCGVLTSLQSESKINHQWCHEAKCTDCKRTGTPPAYQSRIEALFPTVFTSFAGPVGVVACTPSFEIQSQATLEEVCFSPCIYCILLYLQNLSLYATALELH